MLFLAVFCGFLAENVRENLVERNREKEYINSLIKDLEYDTLQFNVKIKLYESKLPYFDSIFLFFNNPASFNYKLPVAYWAYTDLNGGVYRPAEPTIQQLKNSGNLRLVKNKKILDSILVYDSHILGDYSVMNSYVEDFAKRVILYKQRVFDNTNFMHLMDDWFFTKINNNADYDLILFSKDKGQLKELYNIYIEMKVTVEFYIMNLRKIRKEAENLIAIIKKKYHLE
jgi:hypothetical protein